MRKSILAIILIVFALGAVASFNAIEADLPEGLGTITVGGTSTTEVVTQIGSPLDHPDRSGFAVLDKLPLDFGSIGETTPVAVGNLINLTSQKIISLTVGDGLSVVLDNSNMTNATMTGKIWSNATFGSSKLADLIEEASTESLDLQTLFPNQINGVEFFLKFNITTPVTLTGQHFIGFEFADLAQNVTLVSVDAVTLDQANFNRTSLIAGCIGDGINFTDILNSCPDTNGGAGDNTPRYFVYDITSEKTVNDLSVSTPIGQSNLRGYWTFDDNTVDDQIALNAGTLGHLGDGTGVSTISLFNQTLLRGTGIIGKSLITEPTEDAGGGNFTLISGNYLQINPYHNVANWSFLHDNSTNFSVSYFIKFDLDGGFPSSDRFHFSSTDGNDNGIVIGTGTGENEIRVLHTLNSGQPFIDHNFDVYPEPPPNGIQIPFDGEWHHVAVVVDKSNSTDVGFVCVDGSASCGILPESDPLGPFNPISDFPFSIGTAFPAFFFDEHPLEFDEVAIWGDYLLSKDEIDQLAGVLGDGVQNQALRGYWTFDTADVVGNQIQNVGTLGANQDGTYLLQGFPTIPNLNATGVFDQSLNIIADNLTQSDGTEFYVGNSLTKNDWSFLFDGETGRSMGWTINFWIKGNVTVKTIDDFMPILSIGGKEQVGDGLWYDEEGENTLMIAQDDTDTIEIAIFRNEGGSNTPIIDISDVGSGNGIPNDGSFHMVSVIADKENNLFDVCVDASCSGPFDPGTDTWDNFLIDDSIPKTPIRIGPKVCGFGQGGGLNQGCLFKSFQIDDLSIWESPLHTGYIDDLYAGGVGLAAGNVTSDATFVEGHTVANQLITLGVAPAGGEMDSELFGAGDDIFGQLMNVTGQKITGLTVSMLCDSPSTGNLTARVWDSPTLGSTTIPSVIATGDTILSSDDQCTSGAHRDVIFNYTTEPTLTGEYLFGIESSGIDVALGAGVSYLSVSNDIDNLPNPLSGEIRIINATDGTGGGWLGPGDGFVAVNGALGLSFEIIEELVSVPNIFLSAGSGVGGAPPPVIPPPTGPCVNSIRQVQEINGTYPVSVDTFDVAISPPLERLDKAMAFLTFAHSQQNRHSDTFRSWNFTALDNLRIYGNDFSPSANTAVGFHGTIFELNDESCAFTQHLNFTMAELLPEGEFELSIPTAINTTTAFIVPTGQHHDGIDSSIGVEEFTRQRIINSTFYGLEVGDTPNDGDTVYHTTIVDLNSTDVTVQRGLGELSSLEFFDIITPTAYNKTNSLFFTSFKTEGDFTQDPDDVAISATLKTNNDILIERDDASTNTVEGLVVVQHFNGSMIATEGLVFEPIPIPVTLTNQSWAIGTVSEPFGFGNGRSSATGPGQFDRSTGTITLENSTHVEIIRLDSADSLDVGLQVIEFPVVGGTIDVTINDGGVDVSDNVLTSLSINQTVNDGGVNMTDNVIFNATLITDDPGVNVTDTIILDITQVINDAGVTIEDITNNITTNAVIQDNVNTTDTVTFAVSGPPAPSGGGGGPPTFTAPDQPDTTRASVTGLELSEEEHTLSDEFIVNPLFYAASEQGTMELKWDEQVALTITNIEVPDKFEGFIRFGETPQDFKGSGTCSVDPENPFELTTCAGFIPEKSTGLIGYEVTIPPLAAGITQQTNVLGSGVSFFDVFFIVFFTEYEIPVELTVLQNNKEFTLNSTITVTHLRQIQFIVILLTIAATIWLAWYGKRYFAEQKPVKRGSFKKRLDKARDATNEKRRPGSFRREIKKFKRA